MRVIDLLEQTEKKSVSDQTCPDQDVLWVVDQIPGQCKASDFTARLFNQTYFPSYNVPVHKEIFNASGNPANVEKYGDWFTYEKCPR